MESKNIRYYLDTTKVQRHETLAGTNVLVSIIEFQNDDFETILSKIYFVTTKLLLRAKEPSRSIYPEILNIDMCCRCWPWWWWCRWWWWRWWCAVGDQKKKKTFVKINWTTFHVIFSVRDLKFIFIYITRSVNNSTYKTLKKITVF